MFKQQQQQQKAQQCITTFNYHYKPIIAPATEHLVGGMGALFGVHIAPLWYSSYLNGKFL